MKFPPFVLICLLASGLAAGCSKKTDSAAPATSASGAAASSAATPASGSFTEAQVFEELGWYIGNSTGISGFGLTPGETDTVLKGVRAAASGKPSPYELAAIGPKMDEVLGKRQSAAQTGVRDKNRADGAAFFAKLKDNKSVVVLPSGLAYEILKPGTGPTPKATDTVKVHYEGKFLDGSVFDSSIQRGEPVEFPLNGVIAGWTEGLQKINKGGKLKLYVPSNLAYGDDGRPGMPPAATLIFEVELLDITTPAAPASPAAPAAAK